MQKSKIVSIDRIPISPKTNKIKRILIIKPSSLGDVIHTFPVIALLSKSLPGVKIDWVINNNLLNILDYLDVYLTGVIPFNRKDFKGLNYISETASLFKNLRKHKYDAVIDLQGLLRSSLMTIAAKATVKVGFANPKESIARFAYSEKIKLPDELKHAIEKNIYIVAKFLGIDFEVPDFMIPVVKKYSGIADQVLKKRGIKVSNDVYMILSPGARWESKRWPPAFFAEVADILQAGKKEMKFVVIGGKDEKYLASEIVDKCKIAKPINIAGRTGMIELVEVLRNAKAMLTNDSGPMHIAAALGVNVFAMFGATDPQLTGPFWNNSVVFQNNEGCIKCFKRNCIRESQECQSSIKASDVSRKILSVL